MCRLVWNRSGSEITLRGGPRCIAIHDWGCDGINWRYCTKVTKGGNKNACVYKKNMDPPSPPSATRAVPRRHRHRDGERLQAAYDWFQAMGSGCPTDAPNGGNCALEPNKNKANALAPASFHVQNRPKGLDRLATGLLVANVRMGLQPQQAPLVVGSERFR